jgi:predicted metal-dependent enzyme (double-stranded beta helix superfamily)
MGIPPISRRALLAAAATAAIPPLFAAEPDPRSGQNGRFTMDFDRDRFVEDCIAANREGDNQAAVREVLARAVSDSARVLAGLGPPRIAGLDVLHRSPTLTIFAAKWAPQMNLVAHDHRLWALIGIYTGREDNIFWRRTAEGIEAFGADVLFAGDVAALAADAIHSVTNPLPRYTAGIHIYGGDFFNTPRSQWDAETMTEERSDGATIRAMFERENERQRGEPPSENAT